MEWKEYFAFSFVAIFYIGAIVPCIGDMFNCHFSSPKEDFVVVSVVHLILVVCSFYASAP